MSLRALQRRVKRMETDQMPRSSPIVVMCGSFDAFADATYAKVVAGKLDGQFLHILDTLRAWDEGRVWVLAYVR